MRKLSRRQTLASMLAAGAGIAAPATRASAARVSFLLINDVYRIEENKNGRGGMARFAAAVKTERARALAEGRHLVCVHAGDTLSPSLLSSFDQGAHMVDLFNAVGLDVFVPGNHEFDSGKDIYFERMGEARFPILAANLKCSDGATPPHHRERLLIEADGLKLAVIGAANEATASASRPGDLVFGLTIPAVLAGAKRARAEGADLVIAIVHADKATGAALMNTRAVDLILSGHNHDLHIDFDGRTAFVESEQDANYVAVVDMDVARTRDEGSRSLPWWPDSASSIRRRSIPTLPFLPTSAITRPDCRSGSTSRSRPLSRRSTAAPRPCARGNPRLAISSPTRSARRQRPKSRSSMGDKFYPAGTKLSKHDILDELPFGNKPC